MLNDITTTAMTTVGSTAHDVLGAIALCVVLAVWGFMQGREVLLALLFGLYPAMMLTQYAPYIYLGGTSASARIGVFVVTLIISMISIRRQLQSSYFLGGMWKWIEVAVLAVCVTGVIGVALYHHVDIGTLYVFSSLFDALFLSPLNHAAWLAVPLVVVPLVIRS
jgi:hypothetical protein